MLGWEVIVKKESDADGQSLIIWSTGFDGLSWLDELVKEGLAQDLGGNGYPCKYLAKAEVILPKILTSPPINENASTKSANTQNHPKPTHVAAMIYYRKTLSSSGPKLTAVHDCQDKIYICARSRL